jgi:CubicO group peptidase (beta-lactamase class C family)
VKQSLYVAMLFAALVKLNSQELYFPPKIGGNWEATSLKELNWDSTQVEPLYNFLEQKKSKAFIVLKNGRIVLEKYFGTFTKDSAWYWASAGKTLTASLVGIAQEEDKLNIQDKTSKYLGEGWTSLTKEQEDKITVWNQLTMTSGLDDRAGDPYCTEKNCLVYKADAGTRWAYHNAPYTLLDRVIESATGSNLNQYTNQKIKISTGMTGGWFKQDYNNIYFSTPRSMARFGLLILNKGKWANDEVIKDTSYFKAMVNTSQSINQSYGYLWWLNGKSKYMIPQIQIVFDGALAKDAPMDMFSGLGKNGQIVNVVPSQNLVLIRMGDDPSQNGLEITTEFNNEIWQYLNKVIFKVNSIEENSNNILVEDKTIRLNTDYNSIKLYNLAGQEVVRYATNERLLDMQQYSGIYFLQLDDKVIKIHLK